MNSEYHTRSLQVSFVSIVVNALLIAVKLFVGIISNSMAIIADAFHSLSDVITTIVVIVSMYISKKPADSHHPFGHGRVEDIGGLFVSLILGGVGGKLFTASWQRITSPQPVHIHWGIIILILLTGIVKFILGYVTQRTARDVHSEILRVDAFHHHADSLTSFLVVVGLIFVERGLVYVDGIIGMVMSLLIVGWAVISLKGFIDNLIGKDAPPYVYERIKDIVSSFEGVEGMHDISVHSYGHNYIISLHVKVPGTLSLAEAQTVAEGVERRIEKEDLGKCIVRVDIGTSQNIVSVPKVAGVIRQFIKKNPLVEDFHKIEVVSTQKERILSFNLTVDAHITVKEAHRIYHQAEDYVKERMHFSRVDIHLEPSGEKEPRRIRKEK